MMYMFVSDVIVFYASYSVTKFLVCRSLEIKVILSSIFWSFYRYVIKNSFALRSRNYFSLCLSSALIIELVFPDKTCLTKSEHYEFLFYWK